MSSFLNDIPDIISSKVCEVWVICERAEFAFLQTAARKLPSKKMKEFNFLSCFSMCTLVTCVGQLIGAIAIAIINSICLELQSNLPLSDKESILAFRGPSC